ncbi:winged helix-turn-helix transcriptional regulator [Streptomyces sp. S3(2020)]|uniref:ArsR/SmtB family transcription factor n=1 Tax=Streptomyces sp. S3(2020) TaxID=2732044 RepID=UPI00148A0016|nr:metalloregulator ArsR/SmtB family transcription factor [Streptomyces sp. S3(2020)]NNN31423.1 winged helix-turn-helix transcriptional regulator [Streptomyces sp. S3(2020)]
MGAQEQAWDEEAAERAVAVLKAVADASRYRLLWALSSGRELPVSELAGMLGAHVAATSQHLAKLRAAGLVTTRREGTRIYYRAANVRGLLEEAQLAAGPGDDGAGPGEGAVAEHAMAAVRESAAATRPAPARGPALGRAQ